MDTWSSLLAKLVELAAPTGHVPPALSLANGITTLPDSTNTSVRVKVAE
jgi:hypothetical protein